MGSPDEASMYHHLPDSANYLPNTLLAVPTISRVDNALTSYLLIHPQFMTVIRCKTGDPISIPGCAEAATRLSIIIG